MSEKELITPVTEEEMEKIIKSSELTEDIDNRINKNDTEKINCLNKYDG